MKIMFRRRKFTPDNTSELQAPLLESKIPIVQARLSLKSIGKVIKEADPPINISPLGREQLIITDVADVLTRDGEIIRGTRVCKVFGGVGTSTEQEEDHFMASGAIFLSMAGTPIVGEELAIRQSPDLEGGYDLPVPIHNLGELSVSGTSIMTPDLFEAVRVAKIFHEIYFPGQISDERVPGLSPAQTSIVRTALRSIFE